MEQRLAGISLEANKALDEIARRERALTGFAMDANERILAFIECSGKYLVERPLVCPGDAR